MKSYFTKIVILLVSSASLFAGRDLNLKYERLWTDLLPGSYKIINFPFAERAGYNSYSKTHFRKKYIGVFTCFYSNFSEKEEELINFTASIKTYAEKYKEDISIFLYGNEINLTKLFKNSINTNIFYIIGRDHKKNLVNFNELRLNPYDKYGPESSSPRWLLIFDDRGKYVDNVRIEVINDVEGKKKYRPWEK